MSPCKCGFMPVALRFGDRWAVVCNHCHRKGKHGNSEADAVNKWNAMIAKAMRVE